MAKKSKKVTDKNDDKPRRGARHLDWGGMRPALLIAHVRTGGTFLAHCLSNHPDVFCPRSEPIAGQHSPWYRYVPAATAIDILSIIWEQPGYETNLCRVTARQVNHKILAECHRRRAKVIHLTRTDIVATAVSDIVNRYVWLKKLPNYATHTYEQLDAPHVKLNPETVVVRARKMLREIASISAALQQHSLAVLPITYEDIVGGDNIEADALAADASDRICDFLGVTRMTLQPAGLRKVNNRPLRETVGNWKEVRDKCRDERLIE